MTYAQRLAEAEAYNAKERQRELRRRELAEQWLHTLYAGKRNAEGPLLIMAAVEAA